MSVRLVLFSGILKAMLGVHVKDGLNERCKYSVDSAVTTFIEFADFDETCSSPVISSDTRQVSEFQSTDEKRSVRSATVSGVKLSHQF